MLSVTAINPIVVQVVRHLDTSGIFQMKRIRRLTVGCQNLRRRTDFMTKTPYIPFIYIGRSRLFENGLLTNVENAKKTAGTPSPDRMQIARENALGVHSREPEPRDGDFGSLVEGEKEDI